MANVEADRSRSRFSSDRNYDQNLVAVADDCQKIIRNPYRKIQKRQLKNEKRTKMKWESKMDIN